MEEKTLFKLARAITDTGTDTVSSEGGTVTYRITSLKRKLVNGKVVFNHYTLLYFGLSLHKLGYLGRSYRWRWLLRCKN